MFLPNLLPLCMVKDFILAKVLYSFQWTWTLSCLTDINLAVSVWMVSVSFPPRGTVHKSEQWHQFPNRLNTTTCLTYKALSSLTVVKVPVFQCLVCILFSFLSELQSKHWYAWILCVESPMKRILCFQHSRVSWSWPHLHVQKKPVWAQQFYPCPRSSFF